MSRNPGKKTESDRVDLISDHIHSEAKVYPTLAAGVTVASSATPYTLGSFVEVVPVSTIAGEFDIHWINLQSVSAAGDYELAVYDTTTLLGTVQFSVLGTPNNLKLSSLPFLSVICPAGVQVQAKLSSGNAVADTATISISYHIY